MHRDRTNREMFIVKALEKILNDRDIKKSQHSQLKKACKDALELARKDLPPSPTVANGTSASSSSSTDGSQRQRHGSGQTSVTSSALPVPRLPGIGTASDDSTEFQAEQYLLPLELACQSKSPRIIVVALDCIQKLIAYGHLVGDQPDLTSTVAGQRQIDRIVQTVCSCFIGANTDEDVQLQILKAVLTVLTSQHVQIHEGSVLHAIRTCYSIHLASRNLVNQTTAKATLTQVINVLFMRMEAQAVSAIGSDELSSHQSALNSASVPATSADVSTTNADVSTTNADVSTTNADVSTANTDVSIVKADVSTTNADVSTGSADVSTTNADVSTANTDVSTINNVVSTVNADVSTTNDDVSIANADVSTSNTDAYVCSADAQTTEADIPEPSADTKSDNADAPVVSSDIADGPVSNSDASRSASADDAVIGETPEMVNGRDSISIEQDVREIVDSVVGLALKSVHDRGESSVDGEVAETNHLTNNDDVRVSGDVTKSSSKETEKEVVSKSSSTGSGHISISYTSQDGEEDSTVITHRVTHILQKDAFLVFRSLCKLSMKPLPDGPPDPKSHELRSKILSLELLLSILQNPGPVFTRHEMFVSAIKQYLCIALTKNGGSSVPEVFQLTLAIFLSLLANFKQHLKKQIEVFFKDIFLNLLEASSSSFEHKWMVVQVLSRICADAQSVVDIYVNYDCDFDAANIFERLVNDLSKMAQLKHGHETSSLQAARDRSIQLKALECLVNILKCMVEWSRDLYSIPESQTNLDTGRENTENSANAVSSDHGPAGCLPPSLKSQLDDVSEYESLKQKKEIWEHGIEIFNRKPRQGLNFLRDRGLLGLSSEAVAAFFHEDHRVDRAVLGDFLGDPDQFNREVMYAYVDQLDFSGQDFVAALRLFLEQFRLPGEAQKIDRLMEKFASRYCACNPNQNIFASADTAYVLAYSIIMLTTDLHSPQVKCKMTQQQYVRMNRGINDSEDLPEQYLCQIYDEIAGNEIKMKAVTSRPGKQQVAHSEKQRRAVFNMEMQQMSSTARSLMEAASHVHAAFTSATHANHVRPMFKAAWAPLLAAFSTGLQECDDPHVAGQCLHGFRCAVRIACIFNTTMERGAFVQALARFTLLANSGIGEIKAKNVDTIKTLIAVAHTDGNYLGSSWLDILRCVSQLELAQLVGTSCVARSTITPIPAAAAVHNTISGNHSNSSSGAVSLPMTSAGGTSNGTQQSVGPGSGGQSLSTSSSTDVSSAQLRSNSAGSHQFDEAVHAHPPTSSAGPLASSASSSAGTGEKRLASVMEAMGDTSCQSVVVAVDRIFTGSTRLDGEAVVYFVDALCQVSRDELAQTPPRMFSLTKIVEISYYNMGRIRLQWSRIWRVLGEHFNKVGSNPVEEVAFFAVDSLRQLSMKFIEKGELANFRFQKDFLRPFEYIMKRNRSTNIQDMVVRCIAQMVNSRAKNIRSGWNNIFSVFHLAASGHVEGVIELAFQTTGSIISTVFENQLVIAIDSFQDAIKCLSEFSCNAQFPDTSMEAIRLIRHCARCVHEQSNLFRETNIEDKSIPEEDRVWVRGWFPIMFELSCVVTRCKLDVRTRALTVMFEIMKTYGDSYRQHWWKDLFQIVFRIFDNMKFPEQRSEIFLHPDNELDKAEWLTTTCNHALYAIVDVFSQYNEILQPILLDRLYSQLSWCVQQDNEQLARSGSNCLENIIISNGSTFSIDTWQRTCNCIVQIFRDTQPSQLLTWQPRSEPMPGQEQTVSDTDSQTKTESQSTLFERLLVNCVVQLEMIQTVDNILFYPTSSRKEDQRVLRVARHASTRRQGVQGANESGGENSSEPVGDDEDYGSAIGERGMYRYLSCSQLLELAECLLLSHRFATRFNSDHEQRNRLWRAGFKGDARPNLLNQETQSLACCLRVLFRSSSDPERAQRRRQFQPLLLDTCRLALQYHSQLQQPETHRAAWTPLLLLILSRLLKISPSQFREHVACYYHLLCDLTACMVSDDVRALLRQCLLRLGSEYQLQPVTLDNAV